jgi:DNA-binding NarL/FixJ family response regulator
MLPLEFHPGLKVVGVATNYITAMHMMIHYNPALVLLDGDLPDNQAWSVLRQMQLKQPRTPCLFFGNSIQQHWKPACYIWAICLLHVKMGD